MQALRLTGEVEKSQVKPVCDILDGNCAMSRKLRNIPVDNVPRSEPDTLMVGEIALSRAGDQPWQLGRRVDAHLDLAPLTVAAKVSWDVADQVR